jgi:hypothetical protein
MTANAPTNARATSVNITGRPDCKENDIATDSGTSASAAAWRSFTDSLFLEAWIVR